MFNRIKIIFLFAVMLMGGGFEGLSKVTEALFGKSQGTIEEERNKLKLNIIKQIKSLVDFLKRDLWYFGSTSFENIDRKISELNAIETSVHRTILELDKTKSLLNRIKDLYIRLYDASNLIDQFKESTDEAEKKKIKNQLNNEYALLQEKEKFYYTYEIQDTESFYSGPKEEIKIFNSDSSAIKERLDILDRLQAGKLTA